MPTITEALADDPERRANALLARAVAEVDRALYRLEHDAEKDRVELAAIRERCERRGRGEAA